VCRPSPRFVSPCNVKPNPWGRATHISQIYCYKSNVPQIKTQVSYASVSKNRTSTEFELKSLPAKHVDTGIGFERRVSILQVHLYANIYSYRTSPKPKLKYPMRTAYINIPFTKLKLKSRLTKHVDTGMGFDRLVSKVRTRPLPRVNPSIYKKRPSPKLNLKSLPA